MSQKSIYTLEWEVISCQLTCCWLLYAVALHMRMPLSLNLDTTRTTQRWQPLVHNRIQRQFLTDFLSFSCSLWIMPNMPKFFWLNKEVLQTRCIWRQIEIQTPSQPLKSESFTGKQLILCITVHILYIIRMTEKKYNKFFKFNNINFQAVQLLYIYWCRHCLD